jgi:hypothetical protein
MERSEAKRYVTFLYREIFGRNPDNSGLACHVEFLERKKTVDATEDLLRRFLASPEAVTALGPRLFGKNISDPQYSDEPISFVVSLGTHCYTSSMLKRNQLRTFASPFDWLFSNLDMIAHCLNDDFKTLLDSQYYRPVPPEQRRDGPTVNLCDHEYYLQHFSQKFVFNHTDPTREQGYKYLQRCVERIRAVFSSSGKSLFVCVLLKAAYAPASLKAVVDAIARRASRFGLNCIVVENPDPDAVMPRLESLIDTTGPETFLLRPVSKLGGTAFTNPIDEVSIVRLLNRHIFRLEPPQLSRNAPLASLQRSSGPPVS